MSVMPSTGKLALDRVPFDAEHPSCMTDEGMRRRLGVEVPQSDTGVARPCGKKCAGRGERSTQNV